tara:strand:- start:1607 stop:1861 length:255 start_codon:yes stop_codon:yes gene_type:complete
MAFNHMRLYTNGVYTGRKDRKITIGGVEHDLDQYAKQHGIELPDAKNSKKTINTDVEEKHEDLERPLDSGDTEVDGDGDSKSTE